MGVLDDDILGSSYDPLLSNELDLVTSSTFSLETPAGKSVLHKED